MKSAFSLACRLSSTVFALVTVSALSGCSTPPVADAPSIAIYQQIDSAAHPVFRSVVEEAAGADWAPMNLIVDPANAPTAAYRMKMDFRIREKPLHDTEVIWTVTTVMLATLYPSTCARYDVELTADLHDSSGNRIKSWHLMEQDTAFLWLFQGGDCMGQTESTIRKIAESMLRDLYSRIERGGVLSAQAAVPITELPLIHVSAKNADSLIERVTKTDAPFDNFTFEPAEGQAIHRTLNIRYEFHKPGPSVGAIVGRGMAAIMTLGVVGVCPPNEMILNAELLDEHGTLVRKYRFSRKIRASMGNDCAPATDWTHPRQAADLLRQLFRQIDDDKVI